jgi:hypothetical protein
LRRHTAIALAFGAKRDGSNLRILILLTAPTR